MPHFVIDYSAELEHRVNPRELISQTFRAAVQCELFNEPAVKVRARSFAYHQSGGGHKDFVNVTIHLLAGRTAEQKKDLTHRVLDQLQALDIRDVSLTVQIYDMETESYAKAVN
ncbi:MAG: 5-carboxymethyl-2-hydroxymuconate isomerase [Alphaproteobacteria bacterium]|nr:MAG: 5-carboxymethyl-2-hydroxymuconate isomerase [Alphaproteobacteria bacterium]